MTQKTIPHNIINLKMTKKTNMSNTKQKLVDPEVSEAVKKNLNECTQEKNYSQPNSMTDIFKLFSDVKEEISNIEVNDKMSDVQAYNSLKNYFISLTTLGHFCQMELSALLTKLTSVYKHNCELDSNLKSNNNDNDDNNDSDHDNDDNDDNDSNHDDNDNNDDDTKNMDVDVDVDDDEEEQQPVKPTKKTSTKSSNSKTTESKPEPEKKPVKKSTTSKTTESVSEPEKKQTKKVEESVSEPEKKPVKKSSNSKTTESKPVSETPTVVSTKKTTKKTGDKK